MWVLLERGRSDRSDSELPDTYVWPLVRWSRPASAPPMRLSHPDERANFSEEFFDNLHRAYDIGGQSQECLLSRFRITRPERA